MLWIIFLLSQLSNGDCPTRNQLPRDFTPQIIQSFLRSNRSIDNPAELICCVARNSNVQIAVAHSSIAAQNSDSQHPRVLLITKNTNGTIRSVMSINSEAPNLNQTHSVEFMYNNASANRVEFYDIDFSATGRRFPMERNPESCMNCHGSGVQGENNPRTIFDNFPWPRFLNAGTIGTGCPSTQKAITLSESQTRAALTNNPRYSCVKDLPQANLTDFEHSLESLNNRRIARELKSTPEYQKYKYALVAAEICDYPDPKNILMNIHLPESVIRKLTGTSTLSSAVQRLRTNSELANYTRQAVERNKTESYRVDQLNNRIGARTTGSAPASIRFPQFDRAGTCEEFPPEPAYASYFGTNTVFNQYFVDSMVNGDFAFAPYRFLLETRGINISNWGQQATSGYEAAPSNLWLELVKAEPVDSKLSRLLRQQALDAEKTMFVIKSLEEPNRTRICKELIRLSYEAFGERPPSSDEAIPGIAQ